MLLPKRPKTYSSSFLLLTKLKCQHTTHRHRGLKPERRQTGKKLRFLRSDRQHVVLLPHISRLNTKEAGRPKMSMVYQRISLRNICVSTEKRKHLKKNYVTNHFTPGEHCRKQLQPCLPPATKFKGRLRPEPGCEGACAPLPCPLAVETSTLRIVSSTPACLPKSLSVETCRQLTTRQHSPCARESTGAQ